MKLSIFLSRRASVTDSTAKIGGIQNRFTRVPSIQVRDSIANHRRELFFVSCFLFSLAAAVPLFGLLRIRLTDEAGKRAVHAFVCRDEPMPLAVDCSPNTKRRSFSVLSLRSGQTPLSVC